MASHIRHCAWAALSLSPSLSHGQAPLFFCARGARGSETNAWGSLFACTVAQTCSRQLVVCLMCALFLLIVCSLWHSSFAHARRRHSRFHRHLLLCYFGGLLLFCQLLSLCMNFGGGFALRACARACTRAFVRARVCVCVCVRVRVCACACMSLCVYVCKIHPCTQSHFMACRPHL